MQVKVNGKEQVIEGDSVSLVDFLLGQGLDPEMSGIAVAINFEVVPRSDWGEAAVKDGDAVEVIAALQGG